MNLETIKSDSKEVFVEGNGLQVVVNMWSNLEGCNIMVHDENNLSHRMSGAFRWEEVDPILVALTAARGV